MIAPSHPARADFATRGITVLPGKPLPSPLPISSSGPAMVFGTLQQPAGCRWTSRRHNGDERNYSVAQKHVRIAGPLRGSDRNSSSAFRSAAMAQASDAAFSHPASTRRTFVNFNVRPVAW